MNEKQMTLAVDWDFSDLTGRVWSEKFRGCRAYWQASERTFWTRGGNRIPAPTHWLKAMPDTDIDGEIWAGYCEIETVASNAVRFGHWSDAIVFKVFDAPEASGTWIERMASAREAIAGIPFAECVEFGIVRNRNEASDIASQIISRGGEGAMFRNPERKGYQRQRTKNLMRIKAHNLVEPWRQSGYQRRELPDFKAGGGLDTSLFGAAPEIDWLVQDHFA